MFKKNSTKQGLQKDVLSKLTNSQLNRTLYYILIIPLSRTQKIKILKNIKYR